MFVAPDCSMTVLVRSLSITGLSAIILTTSPSISVARSATFLVVVLSTITPTLLVLTDSYPIIDTINVYVPGETLSMKYSPFASVEAPDLRSFSST